MAPLQPRGAGLRRCPTSFVAPSRQRARVLCRSGGIPGLDAIERSVGLINGVLSKLPRSELPGSMSARGGAGTRSAEDLEAERADVLRRSKTISLSAKGSGSHAIEESPDCSVTDYLTLPLEEYSVLNPEWITRTKSAAGSDAFRLTLPLESIMDVNLTPSVLLTVTPDPAAETVTFSSSESSFGDPMLDRLLGLDVRAVISAERGSGGGLLRRRATMDPALTCRAT